MWYAVLAFGIYFKSTIHTFFFSNLAQITMCFNYICYKHAVKKIISKDECMHLVRFLIQASIIFLCCVCVFVWKCIFHTARFFRLHDVSCSVRSQELVYHFKREMKEMVKAFEMIEWTLLSSRLISFSETSFSDRKSRICSLSFISLRMV